MYKVYKEELISFFYHSTFDNRVFYNIAVKMIIGIIYALAAIYIERLSATHLTYTAGTPTELVRTLVPDYHHESQYPYGYGLQDKLILNNRHGRENHNENIIEGSYSVLETDGSRHTVQYIADPINGFNTIIDREPASFAFKTIVSPVINNYSPVLAKAAPVSFINYPATEIRSLVPEYRSPLKYKRPLKLFGSTHPHLYKSYGKRPFKKFVKKIMRYKKRPLPVKIVRVYH